MEKSFVTTVVYGKSLAFTAEYSPALDPTFPNFRDENCVAIRNHYRARDIAKFCKKTALWISEDSNTVILRVDDQFDAMKVVKESFELLF